MSVATAFASQAARNVGNDSTWAQLGKEQWSTDPNDPMKGASTFRYMTEGYSRTSDQFNNMFGTEKYDIGWGKDGFGWRTNADSPKALAKEELIRTERRDFDMKRVGFDMEQRGYDANRTATNYDSRLAVVRSNEDAVAGLKTRISSTSDEMIAAHKGGDRQKADDLEGNIRKYELELAVKQKILDVSKQVLAALRAKSDALRDVGNRSNSSSALNNDKFSNRELTLSEYTGGLRSNADKEKAAIKALGLPPREEEDRLRAIDDKLAGDLSNEPLLIQQRDRRREQVDRSATEHLREGTSFDNIHARE